MVLLPKVRLYLLGPLRIESEGQPVRLPTRKVEALLAYLVLHPGSHSREKLAALFWGDSPDPEARRSLRNAVHMLRHELHPDIVMGRETVELNSDFPLWVDVLAFETHATQALIGEAPDAVTDDLDLYRGDLLPELYDDWVVRKRERYQRLYLDLILHLTQYARSQGEHDRVAGLARRILACDPTEEAAHRHLMFSLFVAGNRNAALKQYDQCVQVLREELDVGPAPETVALYRRIRTSGPPGETSAAFESNLPLPLTSFVGRETQVNALRQLIVPGDASIHSVRLATLTGPGGCGKTRLAIEVARALAANYPDGVWWVDLAPLREEAQVPRAVARVLGVRADAETAFPDILTGALRRQRALLVLDNCEHLVSACAGFCEMLLSACPQVQILATSREALKVPGEVNWPVPPLALPEEQAQLAGTDLAQWEGVRLFVERAHAARSDFRLTPTHGPGANASAVVEVCHRLDGLPLAIELAAAQVRVLTPQEILARLADRFRLLAESNRTALPRHQTLRTTVDWSYELLTEPERLLLRRLAVFAGGWTLDAAEAVVPGEGITAEQVLAVLRRLVDKSLVVAEPAGEHTRYRLLETLREYAAEKLAQARETTIVQHRRLAYFLTLVETAEPHLRGREQLTWLQRLDEEYANLQAALEWALRRDREPDQRLAGLRLATAMTYYWTMRGLHIEGVNWLEKALAETEGAPLALRARAFYSAGYAAVWANEHLAAAAFLEQSLSAAQAAGDPDTLAQTQSLLALLAALQNQPEVANRLWQTCTVYFRANGKRWELAGSLLNQGIAACETGDYEAARCYDQESAALFRALGDHCLLASVLSHLAWIAYKQGDYAAARPLLEYRLAVGREFGFPLHLYASRCLLGEIALAEGDYTSAANWFKENLVLLRRGTWQRTVGEALQRLALLARAKGSLEMAVRLLAAVDALLQPGTAFYFAGDLAARQSVIDGLRADLGPAMFDAAWAAGSALDLDQAIEEALAV
jgi:predicted ATPase/DNA-binding SARP family transcriptional activator